MHPAYAAGLIDGEGSIGSHKRSRGDRTYYTARVQIGMSTPGYQALAAMQDEWGGSLTLTRRATEVWAAAYTWTVQGREARDLLTAIHPYLLVKREQALAALEIEAIKDACPRLPNGRPTWGSEAETRCAALKARLHDLNRKGPRASATTVGGV